MTRNSGMLGHYLRLAWVDTRRSPWLVVMVVLTLAVGLMASMSTLALRHALTGDPIPGKSARLLTLQGPATDRHEYGLFSYAQTGALRRLGGSHADPVVSGEAVIMKIGAQGNKKQFRGPLSVRYTTADFFRVFNAPLKAGRVWSHHEQMTGAPVAVLDVGWAHVLFPGGNAVGKQVRIGTTLYTVTGVMEHWHPRPRYYDLKSPSGAFGSAGDAIYVPYTAVRYAPSSAHITTMLCHGAGGAPSIPEPDKMAESSCRWLSMWYLVHTPNDVSKLDHALDAELPQFLPAAQAKKLQLLNVRQILARADLVPTSLRTYVWLGIAFLALCIINASGMQLSRAMRRTSSIGIRRALGARRADIVWQYLWESVLVCGVGGMIGIALTYGALALVRQIPERFVLYSHMAHVDGRTLAVMIGIALLCSVLAGLVPALVASRADPALAIKDVE